MMFKTPLRSVAAMALAVLVFPQDAAAVQLKPADKARPAVLTLTASPITDSDGSDRINLADRLTMLTQRVAASSCALTSGIDVQANHDILETSAAEFERIVLALRDGDEGLHIMAPETNRRMLHDIEEIWAEWEPTREAIAAVLADGHDVDAAHIIDDHNLALLALTQRLTEDISGVYSHPYEMSQTDALMIQIAGRQRMLTQKMAKDSCEIWTHYHEETAIPDLQMTQDIFEKSLQALRDGMPAVGIQPAPTDEIRDDLDRILTRWEVARENQEVLLAGGTLAPENRAQIFRILNTELDELNLLVKHYTDYAERHH